MIQKYNKVCMKYTLFLDDIYWKITFGMNYTYNVIAIEHFVIIKVNVSITFMHAWQITESLKNNCEPVSGCSRCSFCLTGNKSGIICLAEYYIPSAINKKCFKVFI